MKFKDTLLGRKVTTALDSILKSRYITLPNICIVKAIFFPVVMYGFESCTIKRLSAKEPRLSNVVLEKTLKSPLDCKVIKPINSKGNQS